MTLMKTFVKVDKNGKIQIPVGYRQLSSLKESRLAELRIMTGTSRKKNILISAKDSAK